MKFKKNFSGIFYFVTVIIISVLATVTSEEVKITQNVSKQQQQQQQQQRFNSILYPYNLTDVYIDAAFVNNENFFELSAIDLPFQLPYFGYRYQQLWVNENGYISFGNNNKNKNQSIIAPFMVEQKLLSNKSNIYLRIIESIPQQQQQHNQHRQPRESLLDRITTDLSTDMIGAKNFIPQYVIIVTWENMSIGTKNNTKNTTNTYQVVLATDTLRTYVMFNYDLIASINNHDDNDDNGKNHYIGFKSDSGEKWELLPYSRNFSLAPLLLKHGYGGGGGGEKEDKNGRYYFRVDEEILSGVCVDIRYWTQQQQQKYHNVTQRQQQQRLTTIPHSGHMLGGTKINFVGPCLDINDDGVEEIVCQFGQFSTTTGVRHNRHHGSCLTPLIIYDGYIDFSVKVVRRKDDNRTAVIDNTTTIGSIEDDNQIKFVEKFYIHSPKNAKNNLIIVNNADRMEEPKEIILKWNPNGLSSNNGTNEQMIQISLWGYKNQNQNDSNGDAIKMDGQLGWNSSDLKPQSLLTYITTLVHSVPLLNGSVTLDLVSIRANVKMNDTDTNDDIQFGFIRLSLITPTGDQQDLHQSLSGPSIWSRIMPLSWYFAKKWTDKYRSNMKNDTTAADGSWNWKDSFCNQWSENEVKLNTSFQNRLPRCPAILDQALVDVGRFMPHPECNMIERNCDTFYRDAMHCVTSARPSIKGFGQTCCYDDYGELLHSDDTIYAGRPSRAYDGGKYPYNTPNWIPAISNYALDVMPFFYCCKWQTNDEENQENSISTSCASSYEQQRHSIDYVEYEPLAIGSVYGDPHFLTFDQTNFTFNGKGVYTLAKVDGVNFELQGRFEQIVKNDTNNDVALNATLLSGIVIKESSSSVVEISVRPADAAWRYKLYVKVSDHQYQQQRPQNIYWFDNDDDDISLVKNFPNVTLHIPPGVQNMSQIIVAFDSGIGVQVKVSNGILLTRVYIPKHFMGFTNGLLRPHSSSSSISSIDGNSVEELYAKFEQMYRVPKHRSLFYDDGKEDDGVTNFQPIFHPNLSSSLSNAENAIMNKICGDSWACQQDYSLTRDQLSAKITEQDEKESKQYAQIANRNVVRCPSLPKPLHGYKSQTRYWPGTTVRFSCDKGYKLSGNVSPRRCNEYGNWTGGSGDMVKCVKQ